VCSYVFFTSKHNQANFIYLFGFSVLFYGAPFFLVAFITRLLKASNHIIHSAFLGVSFSLIIVASLWLLPQAPSGLPIQWMVYWPLSAIFGLAGICVNLLINRYKNT